MKKTILLFSIIFFYFNSVFADTKIKSINEGNVDAKVSIIVYESLTCGHCADFHKEIYPCDLNLQLFHPLLLLQVLQSLV